MRLHTSLVRMWTFSYRMWGNQLVYKFLDKLIVLQVIARRVRSSHISADTIQPFVYQLLELTNLLQEHIYEEFKKKGGEIELKPLLPGAIELPNDKYRLRISQLEDKLSISENKLSISENKLAQYKKENTQYKDKIRVLERHIQELLKKNP